MKPRPSRLRRSLPRVAFGLAAVSALMAGCFERADRWYLDESAPACTVGSLRCTSRLLVCVDTPQGTTWLVEDDCAAQGRVCVPELLACTTCAPASKSCEGQTVLACDDTGETRSAVEECDTTAGAACRDGACVQLCDRAAERRSNVGCEYWAVDLDNAHISDTLNAAAQQFAVVLSNAQPDLPAEIVIEQDDAEPGEPNVVVEVARAVIPAFSARVFRLGPREVDGSAPGTFDTGTHTALSRAAYRIRSNVPIVAYQFNPLENVNVFSNDASLLKPFEAVAPAGNGFSDSYVVLGWPQTIAATDDPRTNFDPQDPIHLRAFLTIVGTRPGTRVRVTSAAAVVEGGPVAATEPGGIIEVELGPFDVLNLETGSFNADFTGSIIAADGPVIAFTGNEASDAPFFSTLSRRRCCADHLEEQLDPIRTAGRRFVATVSPNRSEALIAAGASIGAATQPEYFRLIAVTDAGARVTTTLEGEYARFELPKKGSYADMESEENFVIDSDSPVMLMSVSPSQAAANIPSTLPGGDPSLLIVPPLEQLRTSYVFLTPDKYSFDFVRIFAPANAVIVFDGLALGELEGCSSAGLRVPEDNLGLDAAETAANWVVHTCQLSFPRVNPNLPSPQNLSPGIQNDGVHRIVSDRPVGVLVDGFDAFVSYAYAGGTELEVIVPE